MPKLKKPRTVNPKHREIMKELGAWLANDLKSDEAPFSLAQVHLGEHGTGLYSCRACGVAKAIIDCASSIAEKGGYEFVETIRKTRLELVLKKKRLERSLALFSSMQVDKERRTRESSRSPVEDVTVLQPGQMLLDGIPLPSSQGSTAEDVLAGLASMLEPLRNVLRQWDSLVNTLAAAEEHLAGGIATPSLAERRKHWPRDYVETKVDCYLSQHGWKYHEIHYLHYPDKPDKGGRTGRKIADRVGRARKSGKPPLIWPFPNEKSDKRARQVREALARLKSSASK